MRPAFLTKIFMVALVSFSGLALFQGPAHAAIPIGQLSALQGKVELIREGKSLPLTLKMAVLALDRIKVDEGLAEVTFMDDSTIKISPNTEMTLDQKEKKKKILGIWSKTYLSRLIKIVKGAVSGNFRKSEQLVTEFETPVLVAAVRGTLLTVSQNPDGSTRLEVDQGVVESYTLGNDGWTYMELQDGARIGVYVDPVSGAASVHNYGTVQVQVQTGDTIATVDQGATATSKIEDDGSSTFLATDGEIVLQTGDTTTTLVKDAAANTKKDAQGNVSVQNVSVDPTKDIQVKVGTQTKTVTKGNKVDSTQGTLSDVGPPAPFIAPPKAPPPPPPDPSTSTGNEQQGKTSQDPKGTYR
ncbi:MAG: FecR domain-containing protein [Pseudomonadota bacterium]